MTDFPAFLLNGYRSFKDSRYAREHGRYRLLAEHGQTPEVMVIACCDSRSAPETIFDAAPGEIFVVRNVANLVPPYEPDGAYHGTSAALEFAVQSLKVRHIVVLGHGRCGGIRTALDPAAEPLSPGDFIGKWMKLLRPAVDEIAAGARLTDAEQQTGQLVCYLTRTHHVLATPGPRMLDRGPAGARVGDLRTGWGAARLAGRAATSEAPTHGEAVAKKLYVKTFGCQMNVYDSARMADVLAPLGYRSTTEIEDADLVVLNTCHIREKAAEKVYSELGRLRALKQARKQRGGEMLLAVAGCVAQAEGDEVAKRAPYVDIVVGPQAYHRLPGMVARASRARRTAVDTTMPAESRFDHLPEELAGPQPGRGVSSFLTIQEGCDRFCTFCVVPYTRGAEYSRPAAAVEAEARRLVAAGAREIVLLGQNVNAYHGAAGGAGAGELDLAGLIGRLAAIEGLERLRYTTSHPRDMTPALIRAHGAEPKLMPFLHLPVQSGSDRVLAAMNRGHTADRYLRLVEALRAEQPGIALSSDFIVGFPDETETDFAATLALVREVEYAQAFSFKYSPRPGTPAAERDDRVPNEVAAERLSRLQRLLDDQKRRFNASMVGQALPVLFEKRGRHPGQVAGRTPFMQWLHVDGDDALIGTVAEATVIEASPNGLGGALAGSAGASARAHDDGTRMDALGGVPA